jgi:hypothetical protein
MTSKVSEFDLQLEKLLDKEKTARINNEHFVSVTILKDIVLSYFMLDHSLLQCQKLGKIVGADQLPHE